MIRRGPLSLALIAFFTLATTAWSELRVLDVQPAPRSLRAPRNGDIVIDFDRPVRPGSIVQGQSFWAFGRWSGAVEGAVTYSRGRQRLIFNPHRVLAAGESVMVVLSHDIQAADGSFLRSGGYSFQFWTQARRSPMRFTELERHSTLMATEISSVPYGGLATDLDGDGFADLAIANNLSNDLRVFMNLGDKSGSFRPFLQPGFNAGRVPSPSEASDFNADGHADIALSGVEGTVAILLGQGDGTFGATQIVEVGQRSWGLTVLDADGDGDTDIAHVVTRNSGAQSLSLLENDGNGFFADPVFFKSGGPSPYGLAAADMNEDGILDLVASEAVSGRIFVLAGNGDGTFTQIGARFSGGRAFVLVVGDVNGDRHEDVTVVHSPLNTIGLLLGDGNGGFSAPRVLPMEAPISTDLGDLDGDGDLDWAVSQIGLGWSLLTNDGRGNFELSHYIPARSDGACALLVDVDNDRDLDLALVDEVADEILIYKNDLLGEVRKR